MNDVAERGIALMQYLGDSLTRNEEQKQFIYQFISHHRKTIPNEHKKRFF